VYTCAIVKQAAVFVDEINRTHCTREMPGERDNARNNARCTKARKAKATHGLDGQHQDVDRTLRGRVSQNDRGQR